ncbi:hypothetical protein BC830DRAFT_1174473, partial [Chytriomyces sp. MP71]
VGSWSAEDPIKAALAAASPAQEQAQADTSSSEVRSAEAAHRAAVRAATEARRREQISNQRQQALLYLLYAADSFVTRANLDARIDECFELEYSRSSSSGKLATFAGRDLDYFTLERLARQKLDGTEAAERDAFDVNKFMGVKRENRSFLVEHSHATMHESRLNLTRGTQEQIGAERRLILSDIVKGTVVGRDGVGAIKKSSSSEAATQLTGH